MVLRIVDPTPSVIIRNQPVAPDNRHEYAASAYAVADDFIPSPPGFDRLHILEYRASTEMTHQAIDDPAGVSGAVAASVTDEYIGHARASSDDADPSRVRSWPQARRASFRCEPQAGAGQPAMRRRSPSK
jgi:hypothetical protein